MKRNYFCAGVLLFAGCISSQAQFPGSIIPASRLGISIPQVIAYLNLTDSQVSQIALTLNDYAQLVAQRQQRMFEYPDSEYHEVYLRSDKALLRAREILKEMERSNRIVAASAPAENIA